MAKINNQRKLNSSSNHKKISLKKISLKKINNKNTSIQKMTPLCYYMLKDLLLAYQKILINYKPHIKYGDFIDS